MSETDTAPETPQQQGAAREQGLLRRLGLRLFGFLTSVLLRVIGATWRVETLGHDPRAPTDRFDRGAAPPAELAALFHESMIPCAWLFRQRGYTVAVSRSHDGDLIRATLLALGYSEPARGSSSRGGSTTLRQLLRFVAEGTTAAVLVDGPRGPARVAKTGIVSLARLSERPIQPVAFSARPAIRLSSWDQSLVPLPFARIVCAYGEPIHVAADTDREEHTEQAIARHLDEALTELHHAADAVLLSRD